MNKTGKLLSNTHIKRINLWIKTVKRTKQRIENSYEITLKLPYKVVSMGVNRMVYAIGNGLVLKVAISIKGIEDNQTEAKLYEMTPPILKRHLAKVVSHGDGWLIMIKHDHPVPRTEEYKQKILKLLNKFVHRDIMPNDIFILNRPEPEWRNLAVNKKGGIVVLDYGNFKYGKPIHPVYRNCLNKMLEKIKEQ